MVWIWNELFQISHRYRDWIVWILVRVRSKTCFANAVVLAVDSLAVFVDHDYVALVPTACFPMMRVHIGQDYQCQLPLQLELADRVHVVQSCVVQSFGELENLIPMINFDLPIDYHLIVSGCEFDLLVVMEKVLVVKFLGVPFRICFRFSVTGCEFDSLENLVVMMLCC